MQIVLDISRTVSRMGAGQVTGIDRVEIAYIQYVIDHSESPLFISRLGKDYAVLDKTGARHVLDQIGIPIKGLPRGLDWVRFRLTFPQRVARSFVRGLSVKIFNISDLCDYLKVNLTNGFDYYNVAHSNLSTQFLTNLKHVNARIHILIHDLIPINFPHFTRPDTIVSFTKRMQAVAQSADRIICNSKDTASQAEDWFVSHGYKGEILTALLGLDHLKPSDQPAYKFKNRPYFLTVGTIEPRKNHEHLFHVWRALQSQLPTKDMPDLLIVGRRGWSNETVFDLLKTDPMMGQHIHLADDMSDETLSRAYKGATALLFPSFTEGYGLPALEAAVHELPIICSDLPVFKEFLHNQVTYLNPSDIAGWTDAILTSLDPQTPNQAEHNFPTWKQHFNDVFGTIRPQSILR